MSAFDPLLVDDGDRLAVLDHSRLLWTLATAGAQLRRAAALAGPAGGDGAWPDRIELDGPPRSLVVATDPATAGVADLLTVLATPGTPTAVLRSPSLPRWCGAADAAVVVSADGRHPRLVALAGQAARRGLALVVVAPVGSPVAVAAGRAPVVDLPEGTAVRAALWSALGPALLAAGRWRLAPSGPGLLDRLADGLDDVAHRCRPGSDLVTNPAKGLAEELAGAVPLVVGAGPLAAVAARAGAAALRLCAGSPAHGLELPDDLPTLAALLAPPAAGDPDAGADGLGDAADDFFRDRTQELAPRPVLVLAGTDGEPDDPALGLHDGGVENADAEREARDAGRAARSLAAAAGARVALVDVPPGEPLVRWAGATLLGQFTAAYLALGCAADPSVPRPGEQP